MNDILLNSSTSVITENRPSSSNHFFIVPINHFTPSEGMNFYSNDTTPPTSGRYNLNALKNNYKVLKSIASLPQNWNGEKAKSFSKKVIDNTLEIIKNLAYQPQIFPTGRNSIQLEFEKKNEDYLEFEIFEDSIQMLIEKGEKQEEKSIEANQIYDITNAFFDA